MKYITQILTDLQSAFNENDKEKFDQNIKLLYDDNYAARESTSDGYHTFNELYYHRVVLFATLCKLMPDKSWKSKSHYKNEEPMYDGMFICGIELPTGKRISYHYENEFWCLFDTITELEYAPKWSGENSLTEINNLREFSTTITSILTVNKKYDTIIFRYTDERILIFENVTIENIDENNYDINYSSDKMQRISQVTRKELQSIVAVPSC